MKRAKYEAAGCPSYWVFDAGRVEVTTWDLGADGYGPPTVVTGEEVYRATTPFAVEIVPSRIIEF